MNSTKLATRSAVATVALGLGMVFAGAAVASADPSADGGSPSANSAPNEPAASGAVHTAPKERTDKRNAESGRATRHSESGGTPDRVEAGDKGDSAPTEVDEGSDHADDTPVAGEELPSEPATERDGDADVVTPPVAADTGTAVTTHEEDSENTAGADEPEANDSAVGDEASASHAGDDEMAPTRAPADVHPTAAVATTPVSPVASLFAVPRAVTSATTEFVVSALRSIVGPLDGSPPVSSPLDWAAAATARRESFGDLLGLTLKTLLRPVYSLFVDLGLAAREESWPGECINGTCYPSSDIPIPQASSEITFLNLTGRQITLTKFLTADPAAFGPQGTGFVLEPARLVEMGFYPSQSGSSQADMTWSDGASYVDVDVASSGVTSNGYPLAASNNLMQVTSFNTPRPLTGASTASNRKTIVFLPAAGTTITIPADDGIGQALVAMAMCGNSGTCTQEATSQEIVYGLPVNVGSTVYNLGTDTISNSVSVTHETAASNGIEENLKIAAGRGVKFTLGPLNFESEINAVFQQKYNHSWSNAVSDTFGVTMTVSPDHYGLIQLKRPMYRNLVDMTIVNKDVTIQINDVEYVSPLTSAEADAAGMSLEWSTEEVLIGTGLYPYPDSNSTPTPPSAPAPADDVVVPEVDEPAVPAFTPKSIFEALFDYVVAQTKAIFSLPAVLLSGNSRAVSSQGFEVVNLTPERQFLWTIWGQIEENESPMPGQWLEPYQMVRVEVDYQWPTTQSAYIEWWRDGESTVKSSAWFYTYSDGSASVRCETDACMDGGYNSSLSAEIMYIINPTFESVDLTNNLSYAQRAIDAACDVEANTTPGSCAMDTVSETTYHQPMGTNPYQTLNNTTDDRNTLDYIYKVSHSQTESYSNGGGLKIKAKASAFFSAQIEVESTVLYNQSYSEKQEYSVTVKQGVPPFSVGEMTGGSPLIRTYGDVLVFLPNSRLIVKDQWLEITAGELSIGPTITGDDEPLP